MLEMSSGMEECKIPAWAKDNMPLAYAGILHSSMPVMSEESLIFYIFTGSCGLGVKGRLSNQKDVTSILLCVSASFFHRVNLGKFRNHRKNSVFGGVNTRA
jgi:hypothetical protein